jgi:hypothetical protein
MAWSMIPAPGTKLGPCKSMCKHTDCAANRQEAEKVCPGCEKIIGYETPMTTMRDKAGLPWIWHNLCAEVDEENRQKALAHGKKSRKI